MQYCNFNKSSAVLIKCITVGGTNATEEFLKGSILDSVLYAIGYSYSNDFGYSFTFGRADNVLMKVNLTTDEILLLKNIGFSAGDETPFQIVLTSRFIHFAWNEDEAISKTQVLYS